MSELRKLLGEERLRYHKDTMRYVLTGVTTDEERFRDLATQGKLDEAVRLVCGPSYDGVAWEWLLEPVSGHDQDGA